MKKYRLSSLLVTFVLALTLLAPFSALAADAPHITSRHAVLMDANYGEILYEKAAREKAVPADTNNDIPPEVFPGGIFCRLPRRGHVFLR